MMIIMVMNDDEVLDDDRERDGLLPSRVVLVDDELGLGSHVG
jgi:hypothetical protein